MPPAARVGDHHRCPKSEPGPVPHVGGAVMPSGCPSVLIGGKPAARKGDRARCHAPADVISTGEPTVLIGGKMAARIDDRTTHGGVVVTGEHSVLIGSSVPCNCLKGAAVERTPLLAIDE